MAQKCLGDRLLDVPIHTESTALQGDNAPSYRRLRPADAEVIAAGIFAERSNVAIAADLGVNESSVRRAAKGEPVLSLIAGLRDAEHKTEMRENERRRHAEEVARSRQRRTAELAGLKPGSTPEDYLASAEALAKRARRARHPDAGRVLGVVFQPKGEEISRGIRVPDAVMFDERRKEDQAAWREARQREIYGTPAQQVANRRAKEAHDRALDEAQAFSAGLVRCSDGSLRQISAAIESAHVTQAEVDAIRDRRDALRDAAKVRKQEAALYASEDAAAARAAEVERNKYLEKRFRTGDGRPPITDVLDMIPAERNEDVN
jgi:hypothetical protein